TEGTSPGVRLHVAKPINGVASAKRATTVTELISDAPAILARHLRSVCVRLALFVCITFPSGEPHESALLARQGRCPRRQRSRSENSGSARRDHQNHAQRHLRLRLAFAERLYAHHGEGR